MMNPYLAPQKHLADETYANSIIEAVLTCKDQSIDNVKKRTRKKDIVYTRHLLCYYLCSFTSFTLVEIAGKVGLADHTSVMYGRNKIRYQSGMYSDVQEDCSKIFEMIMSDNTY